MPPRYEKRRGHKRDIGWLVKAGAQTRVILFVNVGSYAHTMPGSADVNTLEEVNAAAISSCIEANPGFIKGFKLHLVGPVAQH